MRDVGAGKARNIIGAICFVVGCVSDKVIEGEKSELAVVVNACAPAVIRFLLVVRAGEVPILHGIRNILQHSCGGRV